MKKTPLILLICLSFQSYGQAPFHILGNLQIHDNGQLGFHTDLINDGMFDRNKGFVGFYNTDRSLRISGTRKPVFYDMLTAVSNDLFLDVAVGVTNFKEFLLGRVITPRNTPAIALDLINDSPYLGASDDAHVDGYMSNTGALAFSFPIGDDFRLRPMRIDQQASVNTSNAAYFFENPNIPSTLSGPFYTTDFQPTLSIVSTYEYWDLDGNTATKVTLTWDPQSAIPTLADQLTDLRVVGWNATAQKWINLGNTAVSGNEANGEITSDVIIPNEYTALTIGSILKVNEDILVFNGMSPNGDGSNDTLIIRGIEAIPNNELTVFNRWGVKVYHKKGYDNSWTGSSEGRATLSKPNELPVGTYYYVLQIEGRKNQTGYIYLQR